MVDNKNKEENKHKNKYDLEERTFEFARRCRDFIKKLPRTVCGIEHSKQLARASASPAANYIEANESLGKKDFCMRIKICRKETKESHMWLRLCDMSNKKELKKEQKDLIQEAHELTKVFGSMVEKCKN